jgi:hypothetical protein
MHIETETLSERVSVTATKIAFAGVQTDKPNNEPGLKEVLQNDGNYGSG